MAEFRRSNVVDVTSDTTLTEGYTQTLPDNMVVCDGFTGARIRTYCDTSNADLLVKVYGVDLCNETPEACDGKDGLFITHLITLTMSHGTTASTGGIIPAGYFPSDAITASDLEWAEHYAILASMQKTTNVMTTSADFVEDGEAILPYIGGSYGLCFTFDLDDGSTDSTAANALVKLL
tara:strand:+ start:222 stop:755 length:534 start_codon:yes stop_codon:yes gene_type:complete